jgi:RNA polymerase sigma factor (sigma-70 family)
MQTRTDEELLRRYVRYDSADAFKELGRRYARLVYTVCFRETKDPTLAEDAAQSVFLLLSQKARTLRDPRKLPVWLCSVATNTSRSLMRNERRRATYEEAYAREAPTSTDPTTGVDRSWDLDRAMGQLKPDDQTVILLRFWERRSLAEVGQTLGVSENTARMRVQRATERLRQKLERLGNVSLSVVALTAALEREAQAAPGTPDALLTLLHAVGERGMVAGSGKAILLAQRVDAGQRAAMRTRGILWSTAALLLLSIGGATWQFSADAPTDARLPLAVTAYQQQAFAPLAGTWDGTLEYTRKDTNRRVRMPVRAVISVGENVLQWQNRTPAGAYVPQIGQTIYLSEWGEVRLTNSGHAQPASQVSGLARFARQGHGTFTLQVPHSYAEMRYRFTLEGDALTCLWEKRNPDYSFQRMNYWTLTRRKTTE